ncbi:hypothetical protein BJ508DRAFT_303533 [Ascobolus immersus RN42]|uniref:Uncharacterized protein n=1 Tax=Ascobolus immersus RN42 TaxID=1160509 RepID=A0A3N4IKR7_ASCIM|nr:hypothetical protein BJ508DRAFT_303533 [Ascobolus immersus RN42]
METINLISPFITNYRGWPRPFPGLTSLEDHPYTIQKYELLTPHLDSFCSSQSRPFKGHTLINYGDIYPTPVIALLVDSDQFRELTEEEKKELREITEMEVIPFMSETYCSEGSGSRVLKVKGKEDMVVLKASGGVVGAEVAQGKTAGGNVWKYREYPREELELQITAISTDALPAGEMVFKHLRYGKADHVSGWAYGAKISIKFRGSTEFTRADVVAVGGSGYCDWGQADESGDAGEWLVEKKWCPRYPFGYEGRLVGVMWGAEKFIGRRGEIGHLTYYCPIGKVLEEFTARTGEELVLPFFGPTCPCVFGNGRGFDEDNSVPVTIMHQDSSENREIMGITHSCRSSSPSPRPANVVSTNSKKDMGPPPSQANSPFSPFCTIPPEIRLEIADHILDWPDHMAYRTTDHTHYTLLTNCTAIRKRFDLPKSHRELVSFVRNRCGLKVIRPWYLRLLGTLFCISARRKAYRQLYSFLFKEAQITVKWPRQLEIEDEWLSFVCGNNFWLVLERFFDVRTEFPRIKHYEQIQSELARECVDRHKALLERRDFTDSSLASRIMEECKFFSLCGPTVS